MGSTTHKVGYVSDQSDVSADVIDDSISIAACDDDDDDSSESLSRILPTTAVVAYHAPVFYSEFSSLIPPSRQTSYRDISPSFLRVFRI